MSLLSEHVKYQPQFNSVLDEVDSLKVRVEELEQENRHLHNTLNALVVLIITFVAVILILDTFKNNISNYFPIIIPLMDNLYQSLFDIKSFIIDLIR